MKSICTIYVRLPLRTIAAARVSAEIATRERWGSTIRKLLAFSGAKRRLHTAVLCSEARQGNKPMMATRLWEFSVNRAKAVDRKGRIPVKNNSRPTKEGAGAAIFTASDTDHVSAIGSEIKRVEIRPKVSPASCKVDARQPIHAP